MYRVAIIGCGRIGSLLEEDRLREKPATHAGAFAAHRNTKIVAACDIDAGRLATFGKKWGIAPDALHTDYRRLLSKERPDIVSIATWTESHAPIVLAAARTPSVKGIYCEKPIARDLREADRMIRSCAQRNIPLVIGHERRFDAHFVNIKKMVDKKEFGELKTIIAHALSLTPPKLPVSQYVGGALFHDGTHLMDLLLYFGGPAKWVTAFVERPHGKKHVETTAVAVIRLHSGVNVFVESGGDREYFKFDLDLQFQRGRIVIGNSGIYLFRSDASRHYSDFRELHPVPYQEPKKRTNPFVGGVRALLTAMRTGRPPVSNGVEARNALQLILATYRSANADGKKVFLPKRKIVVE